MKEELTVWVMYKHPSDYPDRFVARKFILDKPTLEIRTGDTIEEVRALLPLGLTCFERHETDPPKIVEMWM